VSDSAGRIGTLPGALLRTLVAQQVHAFAASETANHPLSLARHIRRVHDGESNILRARYGVGRRRVDIMPTGISIFLIAVGAILYFAVTKVVNGLNLGAVGVILMIVGALGLVVSLVMLGMTRARATRTTVVHGTTPAAAGTTVLQQDSR
jgi:hypothetical protein